MLEFFRKIFGIRTSVDNILQDLKDKIDQLESVAEECEIQSDKAQAKIDALAQQRRESEAELARALSVATRIRSLIE